MGSGSGSGEGTGSGPNGTHSAPLGISMVPGEQGVPSVKISRSPSGLQQKFVSGSGSGSGGGVAGGGSGGAAPLGQFGCTHPTLQVSPEVSGTQMSPPEAGS